VCARVCVYVCACICTSVRVCGCVCLVPRGRSHVIVSVTFVTLPAVVYNYNNNINIIIMSINTFKVRDGRIRVYKKYVYKYVPFRSFPGRHAVEDSALTQLHLHLSRLSLIFRYLTNAALCLLVGLVTFILSLPFLSLSLSHAYMHTHSLPFSLSLSLARSPSKHSHSHPLLTFIPVRFNRALCSAFITATFRHASSPIIVIIIAIIINIHDTRGNSSDNNDNILQLKWRVGSLSAR